MPVCSLFTGCLPLIEKALLFVFQLNNFWAHQHKASGMKIKLSRNSDHDGISHGVECSQEGDRIPPLKSSR